MSLVMPTTLTTRRPVPRRLGLVVAPALGESFPSWVDRLAADVARQTLWLRGWLRSLILVDGRAGVVALKCRIEGVEIRPLREWGRLLAELVQERR